MSADADEAPDPLDELLGAADYLRSLKDGAPAPHPDLLEEIASALEHVHGVMLSAPRMMAQAKMRGMLEGYMAAAAMLREIARGALIMEAAALNGAATRLTDTVEQLAGPQPAAPRPGLVMN